MAPNQSSIGLKLVLNTTEEFDFSDKKRPHNFWSRKNYVPGYFSNITTTLKSHTRNWYKDRSQEDKEDGNGYSHIFECIKRIYSNIENLPWKKEDEVCEELPVEVWGEIGKRLSSRLDILRFRSVCKNWRSSLPSPTRFPLKVPPLLVDVDPLLEKVPVPMPVQCTITEESFFLISPWEMVRLEEVDPSGKFYANRIFWCVGEGDYMTSKISCPEISFTSWWRRKCKRTLYDRLSFVHKSHHLRITVPQTDDPTQLDYIENGFADRMVIVSSSRDMINLSYAKQSDLIVVARMSAGGMLGRLALLRLHGSYETWAWDTEFCTRLFLDVNTYRRRLCALDIEGCVVMLDFDDSGALQITQLSPPWPGAYLEGRSYVYENFVDGCLHVVTICNEYQVKYKLILDSQTWIKIHV